MISALKAHPDPPKEPAAVGTCEACDIQMRHPTAFDRVKHTF